MCLSLLAEIAIYLCFRDLDDSRQFLRRHNRDMAWSTMIHFEKLPFQWALLGTESAISVCHVDASGLATYVECAIGEKLWFVAEGSWSSIPDGENGWDVEKLKFQCVHLKPGVRLYDTFITFSREIDKFVNFKVHEACPTTLRRHLE